MRLDELGEFGLIRRITRPVNDRSVVRSIGDDAAVIKFDEKRYLAWTVDMMVEGDHFNLEWATAEQVGMKAMEVNVSDIAATGGIPRYALVSLCLTPQTTVEFIDGLYKGMWSVCDKYGFNIIGGNMTHGKQIAIDVTMLGFVEKNRLCTRGGARPGDIICVTGDLGGSTAGLWILRKNLNFKENADLANSVKEHLEPKCRLKESMVISEYATAMIDVSDGLASEVGHICEISGVGAEVFKDKVPLSRSTVASAAAVGKDPYDFALHGGEDFELVFTIAERDLQKIKIETPVTVVGRILEKSRGIHLIENCTKKPLGGGYDHFRL